MEAGQSLRIPVISRSRFDEKALKEAVMYILSKDNVVPISWGTKDIKLTDNETVTLPALTRQKTPKHLYDNYLAFCNNKDTDAAGESFPSISRGIFYEILSKVTSGGEKMLTAVDYVTGVLVND